MVSAAKAGVLLGPMRDKLRVALSIREKLQVPEGW